MRRVEYYRLVSQQYCCTLLEGISTACDIRIGVICYGSCSITEANIFNRCDGYYRYRIDSELDGSRIALAVVGFRYELQGVRRTGCCQCGYIHVERAAAGRCACAGDGCTLDLIEVRVRIGGSELCRCGCRALANTLHLAQRSFRLDVDFKGRALHVTRTTRFSTNRSIYAVVTRRQSNNVNLHRTGSRSLQVSSLQFQLVRSACYVIYFVRVCVRVGRCGVIHIDERILCTRISRRSRNVNLRMVVHHKVGISLYAHAAMFRCRCSIDAVRTVCPTCGGQGDGTRSSYLRLCHNVRHERRQLLIYVILDGLGVGLGERYIHTIHFRLADRCVSREGQRRRRVDGEGDSVVALGCSNRVLRGHNQGVRTIIPRVRSNAERLNDRCSIVISGCTRSCSHLIAIGILHYIRVLVGVSSCDFYVVNVTTLADAVDMSDFYRSSVVDSDCRSRSGLRAAVSRQDSHRQRISTRIQVCCIDRNQTTVSATARTCTRRTDRDTRSGQLVGISRTGSIRGHITHIDGCHRMDSCRVNRCECRDRIDLEGLNRRLFTRASRCSTGDNLQFHRVVTTGEAVDVRIEPSSFRCAVDSNSRFLRAVNPILDSCTVRVLEVHTCRCTLAALLNRERAVHCRLWIDGEGLNYCRTVAVVCRNRPCTQCIGTCSPTARIDSELIRCCIRHSMLLLTGNLVINSPAYILGIVECISNREGCNRMTFCCYIVNRQPWAVVDMKCSRSSNRRAALRGSGLDGNGQRVVAILQVSLRQGNLNLLVNDSLICSRESESTGLVAIGRCIGRGRELKYGIFPALANRNLF